MYNYIVVNYDSINNNNKDIDCEYISFKEAIKLLNKYKVYIFKYKKDEHILYLEHPFSSFYSCNKINLIENNNEEDLTSFTYIEIRLVDKYPIARYAVNMLNL
jgi:hypothetical protein